MFAFALAACGLCVACASDTPATCSPAGFTACSGNTLVTCVSASDSATGGPGTQLRDDCTATGQVCIDAPTSASCGAPSLGDLCFSRNMKGCGANDNLLRCVWVSEQPDPSVSGDVGVWRVETDCGATTERCPLMTAACAP
jgi:hypothetical protein